MQASTQRYSQLKIDVSLPTLLSLSEEDEAHKLRFYNLKDRRYGYNNDALVCTIRRRDFFAAL